MIRSLSSQWENIAGQKFVWILQATTPTPATPPTMPEDFEFVKAFKHIRAPFLTFREENIVPEFRLEPPLNLSKGAEVKQ